MHSGLRQSQAKPHLTLLRVTIANSQHLRETRGGSNSYVFRYVAVGSSGEEARSQSFSEKPALLGQNLRGMGNLAVRLRLTQSQLPLLIMFAYGALPPGLVVPILRAGCKAVSDPHCATYRDFCRPAPTKTAVHRVDCLAARLYSILVVYMHAGWHMCVCV